MATGNQYISLLITNIYLNGNQINIHIKPQKAPIFFASSSKEALSTARVRSLFL